MRCRDVALYRAADIARFAALTACRHRCGVGRPCERTCGLALAGDMLWLHRLMLKLHATAIRFSDRPDRATGQ